MKLLLALTGAVLFFYVNTTCAQQISYGGTGAAAPTTGITGYSTWVNQGNSIETNTPVGMAFNIPSNQNAHAVSGLTKVAPSVPYVATMQLMIGGAPQIYNDTNVILGWYDGTNGIDGIAINPYNGFLSYSHNLYSTFSTPVLAPTATGTNSCNLADITNFGICSFLAMEKVVTSGNNIWIQLANNGSTISVSASLDGANYQVLWSFPISNGFLTAGYNDLIIGGDANFAQMLFTITNYTD